MNKETFNEVQASNCKLACILATEEVSEYWMSQLPSEIKFIDFFGFADDEHISYAAFSVPMSMTREQFHELINMDCNSFILKKDGCYKW